VIVTAQVMRLLAPAGQCSPQFSRNSHPALRSLLDGPDTLIMTTESLLAPNEPPPSTAGAHLWMLSCGSSAARDRSADLRLSGSGSRADTSDQRADIA
jgi:hypothetical protein